MMLGLDMTEEGCFVCISLHNGSGTTLIEKVSPALARIHARHMIELADALDKAEAIKGEKP